MPYSVRVRCGCNNGVPTAVVSQEGFVSGRLPKYPYKSKVEVQGRGRVTCQSSSDVGRCTAYGVGALRMIDISKELRK